MLEPDRYWFPAKRYGWGWGLRSPANSLGPFLALALEL